MHRADGERLAVSTDRDSAVAAALAHELAPVSGALRSQHPSSLGEGWAAQRAGVWRARAQSRSAAREP